MNIFFTRHIDPPYAFLEGEAAHHAGRVICKRVGEELAWVDGRGTFYTGRIEAISKKTVRLQILDSRSDLLERPFQLHLAVAPTKNIARFEWLLEKAVEVGVERITPLLCRHSERKQIRRDRLERILIAAMKQSGHARLPVLDDLMPFGKFLSALQAPESVQKFIAHCAADPQKEHFARCYQAGKDAIALIGPEGDFSPEEIAEARNAGFTPVHLGPGRLRTETAGLVVAVLVANL